MALNPCPRQGLRPLFSSMSTPLPPTNPLHPIQLDMPRPFGMTACAGTEIPQGCCIGTSPSVSRPRRFTTEAFIALRHRWFRLSPSDQDSQLLPPKCSDRVSVPTGRYALSSPLGIIDLVSRYPTNHLIPVQPISPRGVCHHTTLSLFGIHPFGLTPSEEVGHHTIAPSYAMAYPQQDD